MSPTTSNGRHARAWSFAAQIEDAKQKGVPGTGQHRASLISAFQKHLNRRFGK